ncbi:MAG: hypothetical protein ACOYID_06850 [Eubacteriales bacterium]|jgi:hypothetical protein
MNRGIDPRGEMFRCGRAMCINNARIENVSTNPRDARVGSMTVSYTARRPSGVTTTSMLILNVDRNTRIRTQAGSPVCLCDVRPGMWADVQFSRTMTRSIPPRADAFSIEVRQQYRPDRRPRPPRPEPPEPRPQRRVTTTRVVSVDPRIGRLTTGSPFNINRQTVFTISPDTRILDRAGRPIRLTDLNRGQRVRVTHANFQTQSIPPQSPAYEIRVL